MEHELMVEQESKIDQRLKECLEKDSIQRQVFQIISLIIDRSPCPVYLKCPENWSKHAHNYCIATKFDKLPFRVVWVFVDNFFVETEEYHTWHHQEYAHDFSARNRFAKNHIEKDANVDACHREEPRNTTLIHLRHQSKLECIGDKDKTENLGKRLCKWGYPKVSPVESILFLFRGFSFLRQDPVCRLKVIVLSIYGLSGQCAFFALDFYLTTVHIVPVIWVVVVHKAACFLLLLACFKQLMTKEENERYRSNDAGTPQAMLRATQAIDSVSKTIWETGAHREKDPRLARRGGLLLCLLLRLVVGCLILLVGGLVVRVVRLLCWFLFRHFKE